MVAEVRRRHPDVWVSVSVTTRRPRPGERDGDHYHFVSDAEFDRLIATDGLLEWAEYAGNRYGTPAGPVRDRLADGLPGAQPGPERRDGCAVAVARVLGPLQETVGRDQAVELGVVHEVVVITLALTRTRAAGGHRHRHPHIGISTPDLGDDRALADARRAGEHGQPRRGT